LIWWVTFENFIICGVHKKKKKKSFGKICCISKKQITK